MAHFCVDCGAYDHTDLPQCPQCGADDHKPVEYNPLKVSRRIDFTKFEESEFEVTSRRRYLWNLLVGRLRFVLKRGWRFKLAFGLVLLLFITVVVAVILRELHILGNNPVDDVNRKMYQAQCCF